MNLLILGSSGLVGKNALQQALTHPYVTRVVAPTRKPLPADSKLINPLAEQLDTLLPAVAGWEIDAVICALGTTSKKAGSKEAFRHVDYDLPLAFAKQAHQTGAETMALVSAIGASVSSSFYYAKTKGEVERDVAAVGFRSLTIFRPSIIGGERRIPLRRGHRTTLRQSHGSNSSQEVPRQSRRGDWLCTREFCSDGQTRMPFPLC
jgi:uncharacterized protein YbjT (DUF2867 family)